MTATAWIAAHFIIHFGSIANHMHVKSRFSVFLTLKCVYLVMVEIVQLTIWTNKSIRI